MSARWVCVCLLVCCGSFVGQFAASLVSDWQGKWERERLVGSGSEREREMRERGEAVVGHNIQIARSSQFLLRQQRFVLKLCEITGYT